MSSILDTGAQASPLPEAAPDLARYQDARTIREILFSARTVAVVGLSPNPLRPSNFVGYYLQRHGYRIVPVNPREREILGETSYPSLTDIPFPVDVVDVFRQPDAVPDIAREAVQIGARALWLQFGVISQEGADVAEQGGLKVIMDRCMKVEHARHLGRMHVLGFNTGNISSRRG
jgi:predicted CoA-binding protein